MSEFDVCEFAIFTEYESDAEIIRLRIGNIASCTSLQFHKCNEGKEYIRKLVASAKFVIFCPRFSYSGAHDWKMFKAEFPQTHRLLTPEGENPQIYENLGGNIKEWIVANLRQIKHKKEKVCTEEIPKKWTLINSLDRIGDRLTEIADYLYHLLEKDKEDDE